LPASLIPLAAIDGQAEPLTADQSAGNLVGSTNQ